jgi:hypothetical protein
VYVCCGKWTVQDVVIEVEVADSYTGDLFIYQVRIGQYMRTYEHIHVTRSILGWG